MDVTFGGSGVKSTGKMSRKNTSGSATHRSSEKDTQSEAGSVDVDRVAMEMRDQRPVVMPDEFKGDEDWSD